MIEIKLEEVAPHIEEGTIQAWFFEEGDPVNEGDDLVEISSEGGPITIPCPADGILTEVYFDEGETAPRGEPLCAIDEEE